MNFVLLVSQPTADKLTLSLGNDDVGLNFAVDSTSSELTPDCGRGSSSGVIEARSPTSFKFAAKRRALAIGNCRHRRRCRTATRSQSGECRWSSKATTCGFCGDDRDISIAVRNPSQKLRRIFRKECSQRPGYGIGKLILFYPVSHVEEEMATRTKNAPGFREGLNFVWKEHNAELADDHVKSRIRKRQLHSVGLPPFDRTSRLYGCGLIEHGLV